MKRVDYCYYIFAEGSGFLRDFKSPPELDTIWGPAIRKADAGSLIWSDAIRVRTCNLQALDRWLPVERRNIDYSGLAIDGAIVVGKRPEDALDGCPFSSTHRRAFLDMARHVCAESKTWAIFVLAFCNDIERCYSLHLDGAIDLIDTFLREEAPDLDQGFCIVSA